MSTLPFASQVNFLDPKLTSDGEPYAPYRYKELVRECYLISKNCNTSYTDIMNITPLEKDYILGFISEEFRRAEDVMKEVKERK